MNVSMNFGGRPLHSEHISNVNTGTGSTNKTQRIIMNEKKNYENLQFLSRLLMEWNAYAKDRKYHYSIGYCARLLWCLLLSPKILLPFSFRCANTLSSRLWQYLYLFSPSARIVSGTLCVYSTHCAVPAYSFARKDKWLLTGACDGTPIVRTFHALGDTQLKWCRINLAYSIFGRFLLFFFFFFLSAAMSASAFLSHQFQTRLYLYMYNDVVCDHNSIWYIMFCDRVFLCIICDMRYFAHLSRTNNNGTSGEKKIYIYISNVSKVIGCWMTKFICFYPFAAPKWPEKWNQVMGAFSLKWNSLESVDWCLLSYFSFHFFLCYQFRSFVSSGRSTSIAFICRR